MFNSRQPPTLSPRPPALSQQFARLRTDGLVTTRHDGKAIFYSLASNEARVAVGAVYEVFCGRKSAFATRHRQHVSQIKRAR